MYELARIDAIASINKDLIYRRWVASQGGVYVSPSAMTPPNPLLDVPERDVVTSSGKRLTLINPAYMTRQVHEMDQTQSGVMGHITSLKPIRAENAADTWEAAALGSFEKGAQDACGVEQKDGVPFLRYMRPMITEKACLGCHAKQGYHQGDIRGGLSVAVPLAPFYRASEPALTSYGLMSLGLALVGVLGVWGGERRLVRNLAAREGVEEALLRSERNYHEIFDSTSEAIFLHDATTGRILDVNAAVLRLYGFSSKEELIRTEAPALSPEVPPYTTQDALAKIAQTLKEGPQCFEWQARKRNGETFWVEVSLRASRIGGEGRVLAVVRDITERKTAQTALRETHEIFSRAFRHAPVLMAVSDMETGRYIEVNETCLASTCYTREEVIGKTGDEVGWTTREDRGNRRDLLMRSGHVSNLEITMRRKDGVLLHCIYSGNIVTIQGRKRLLSISVDVTQRRLLEDQLRRAQKLESVGQLAGGVAHDFNNILAAIMLHLGLLGTNPALDPAMKESLKELMLEAQRASGITRQLLLFSRQSSMEPKPLDLNDLVANLLKMLGRLIGEQVTLQFQCKEGLPMVLADPGMIEQVIMNLAVNARDAMPRGGLLTIRVECEHLPEERVIQNVQRPSGDYLRLSVTDTGCGMSEDTLQRIFEPFFTTKEVGKGTGLGLATVHGIVAQHWGWVDVESELGKGSTFRVFLPARERVATPRTQEGDAAAIGGKETILPVEDEASLRRVLGGALRTLGYNVIEASTAREGVERWRKGQKEIKLLLTDMVLPDGQTGLELADLLKKERSDLRVIVCSGYSAEQIRPNELEERGMAYLAKPFDVPVLAALIRRCLDRRMPGG